MKEPTIAERVKWSLQEALNGFETLEEQDALHLAACAAKDIIWNAETKPDLQARRQPQ